MTSDVKVSSFTNTFPCSYSLVWSVWTAAYLVEQLVQFTHCKVWDFWARYIQVESSASRAVSKNQDYLYLEEIVFCFFHYWQLSVCSYQHRHFGSTSSELIYLLWITVGLVHVCLPAMLYNSHSSTNSKTLKIHDNVLEFVTPKCLGLRVLLALNNLLSPTALKVIYPCNHCNFCLWFLLIWTGKGQR